MFPKAKIHRFNDDVSCAPPPGTYDPKVNDKVKGLVLSSTKRFPGQQCPSSSLDSIVKAVPSSITFRTPQVVRRKVELTPRLKYLQQKHFDTPGCSSTDSSCDRKFLVPRGKNEKSLADNKRLEQEMAALCDQHFNQLLERDWEINKLKEDLKEIKVHEEELKAILEEKNMIATERSKELLEVKRNLDIFVERIEKERQEQKILVDKLQETIITEQSRKEDLESIINEKQTAILKFNDKLKDLENELKIVREENKMYFAEIMKNEQTNSEILNRVIMDSGLEMEGLEKDLTVKVKLMEQQFSDAHTQEEINFQSKLNLVSHDFEVKKLEMESKMEECFKQLEELENLVNQKSKDFFQDIKESDERCKYVYRALCKVESERDNLLESDLEKNVCIMEIKRKSKALEEDLKQYKTKCKQYEVTLSTMQGTITALSERLRQSEKEVERLNSVENNLEGQKRELEEDIQRLLSEVVALRNGMDKMENDIIKDVTTLKEQLSAKVEHLKIEGMKQVNALNSLINEKQRTIDVLLKENSHYKKDVYRKEKNINELHDKVKKYQEDVLELRHCCSKMEEDFNEKLSAQKNVYKIVSDKFEDANELIGELQNLKSNHENLIIVLNENLRKFEKDSEDCKGEMTSLKELNLQQSHDISKLKSEMKNKQLEIESYIKKETTQQQNLDKITSNYEAVKEKYSALKSDNDKMKALLRNYQDDLSKKTKECKAVSKSFECLKVSLKAAEENILTLKEKNDTIENQLAQGSKYTSEGSQIMLETIEQMQAEKEYLQSEFNFAREKIETETIAVQQEKINNAELIVELSVKIDCLEAEKNSLALQLEDANMNICSLRSHVEDKDRIINSLTTQKNIAEENSEDCRNQVEKLHESIRKFNEEAKQYNQNELKLIDAEEKINDLESKLIEKEMELERWNKRMEETDNLKEEIDVLSTKLKEVTADRDKINDELTELMGHQNVHQKIKHISKLKERNYELQQAFEKMQTENRILKKKLDKTENEKKKITVMGTNNGKENATPLLQVSVRKNTTPKKTLASPSVLKDHNY